MGRDGAFAIAGFREALSAAVGRLSVASAPLFRAFLGGMLALELADTGEPAAAGVLAMFGESLAGLPELSRLPGAGRDTSRVSNL